MHTFLRFPILLALLLTGVPLSAQSRLEMGHAAQSADTARGLQKLQRSFDRHIEAVLSGDGLSDRQRKRIERLRRRLHSRIQAHPSASQNDRQRRTGTGLLLAGALGNVVAIASIALGAVSFMQNSSPYPAVLILTGMGLMLISFILGLIGLIMVAASSGDRKRQ